MHKFQGLEFCPVEEGDIEVLTTIMKRAFNEDSRRHLGRDGGPEGYDNGDFIRKWYFQPGTQSLKIYKAGALIGAMSLYINYNNEERKHILGNIFIDPEHQDKGIGSLVWKFIESQYPGRWTAETPIFSMRNHNFYVNKCGFKVIRIDNPKDRLEGSYVLEKEVS